MQLVADNLRITAPPVQRAVEMLEPEPVRVLVKQCEKSGAQLVDINSGPLTRNPDAMGFLVKTVQETTRLPILIDTANPKAVLAGLEQAAGLCIVNGISLEPRKMEGILPLAAAHNADLVCYLLTPDSHVPAGADERLAIAAELFGHCEAAGISRERMIIDPVIAPLAWSDGGHRNLEALAVIRLLPEILGGPVRTIAGISNLTAGQKDPVKKMVMESAYLPMLAEAGLDYALLDMTHDRTVQTAIACNMLLNRGIFAWSAV